MRGNEEFNRKQREKAKPRALRAQRLRSLGKTWRQVGKALGVTAQRAQALAAAHFTGAPNGKAGGK